MYSFENSVILLMFRHKAKIQKECEMLGCKVICSHLSHASCAAAWVTRTVSSGNVIYRIEALWPPENLKQINRAKPRTLWECETSEEEDREICTVAKTPYRFDHIAIEYARVSVRDWAQPSSLRTFLRFPS